LKEMATMFNLKVSAYILFGVGPRWMPMDKGFALEKCSFLGLKRPLLGVKRAA
jgi:hypothetical protein